MPYALLADAVVVIHGLYIVFVVLGALLALRWRRVLWLHVPAALWGAWVELAGRVCPLTPLENHLRRLAGSAGYEGGFIETYLLPLIYPGALTREVQIVLGGLLLAVNALIYAWVLRDRGGGAEERSRAERPARRNGRFPGGGGSSSGGPPRPRNRGPAEG